MRILPKAGEDVPTVAWLFLDLNSYFASVEQQERPELRGRPVGVIPLLTEHTCCIAVSYEAKAYGVKTGTNVAEAQALCPHIVLVEARPKLYVDYHLRIVAAANNCLPVAHIMSVDEMAFRLMGRERAVTNATRLAVDLKEAIRGVGDTLRCSIGLAPNRYLAKLASDMLKPDGMTVLLRRDLPRALFRLELRDLIGVGRAMERRIHAHGIKSVEQLCQLSPQQMRKVWGSVQGERMWHLLRGADFNDPECERKSLGRQHVLAPEYRTRQQAYQSPRSCCSTRRQIFVRIYGREESAALSSLCARAIAGTTGLRLNHGRHNCASASAAIRSPCSATWEKLWESCPATTPLQVGVWLSDLVPDEQHSLSLFENDERQFRLSSVVDTLNDRFGQRTVYLAGIHSVRDTAPTRIAFTSIPDLKEF